MWMKSFNVPKTFSTYATNGEIGRMLAIFSHMKQSSEEPLLQAKAE